MPTVVSIRNDTIPGDGGDVRVYLRPRATADSDPTQSLMITVEALRPGESVGLLLPKDTQAIVVETAPATPPAQPGEPT